MAEANITTNTTTTLDVPAGKHRFTAYGTWSSLSLDVQHADSGVTHTGLGTVTADADSTIETGGESVAIVSTSGAGSQDITVKVLTISAK